MGWIEWVAEDQGILQDVDRFGWVQLALGRRRHAVDPGFDLEDVIELGVLPPLVLLDVIGQPCSGDFVWCCSEAPQYLC